MKTENKASSARLQKMKTKGEELSYTDQLDGVEMTYVVGRSGSLMTKNLTPATTKTEMIAWQMI